MPPGIAHDPEIVRKWSNRSDKGSGRVNISNM
jgi:hypothetical protein